MVKTDRLESGPVATITSEKPAQQAESRPEWADDFFARFNGKVALAGVLLQRVDGLRTNTQIAESLIDDGLSKAKRVSTAIKIGTVLNDLNSFAEETLGGPLIVRDSQRKPYEVPDENTLKVSEIVSIISTQLGATPEQALLEGRKETVAERETTALKIKKDNLKKRRSRAKVLNKDRVVTEADNKYHLQIQQTANTFLKKSKPKKKDKGKGRGAAVLSSHMPQGVNTAVIESLVLEDRLFDSAYSDWVRKVSSLLEDGECVDEYIDPTNGWWGRVTKAGVEAALESDQSTGKLTNTSADFARWYSWDLWRSSVILGVDQDEDIERREYVINFKAIEYLRRQYDESLEYATGRQLTAEDISDSLSRISPINDYLNGQLDRPAKHDELSLTDALVFLTTLDLLRDVTDPELIRRINLQSAMLADYLAVWGIGSGHKWANERQESFIIALAEVTHLRPTGGSCTVEDLEMLYPERGASTYEPKLLCRNCTVALDCLKFALKNSEKFGIWGGLSERERRRARKAKMSAEEALEIARINFDAVDEQRLAKEKAKRLAEEAKAARAEQKRLAEEQAKEEARLRKIAEAEAEKTARAEERKRKREEAKAEKEAKRQEAHKIKIADQLLNRLWPLVGIVLDHGGKEVKRADFFEAGYRKNEETTDGARGQSFRSDLESFCLDIDELVGEPVIVHNGQPKTNSAFKVAKLTAAQKRKIKERYGLE